MPQASAQAQCVKDKTGTWGGVFPAEQVTEQQSLLYVKKLLAVSVSSITYLRGIFPDSAFGDRCIGDLELKILRDDSDCHAASQVISWMKGSFDALSKKYLKTIVFGIYTDPEKPDNVIESYTFKFSYENGRTDMDMYRNKDKVGDSGRYTAEDTKKATIHLLRTLLILTRSLEILPDNVLMTMKLTYYDDVTPQDYEPAGFRPAKSGTFIFDEEATNVRVGEVATNFHAMRVRLKTRSREYLELASSQQNASQQVDDSENPTQHVAGRTPGPSGDAPQDADVQCPCGFHEDDGVMIACEVCRKWQHALCFKILNEEDAPEKHYCSLCAPKMKIACTDPLLVGLDAETLMYVCLWRRALEACREPVMKWDTPTLAKRLGCSKTHAHFILDRLQQENVLVMQQGKKKRSRQIDQSALTAAHQRYILGNELLQLNPADVSITAQASQLTQQPDNARSSANQMDTLTEMADNMTMTGRVHQADTAKDRKRSAKRDASGLDLSDSEEKDDFAIGKKRRKASKAVH